MAGRLDAFDIVIYLSTQIKVSFPIEFACQCQGDPVLCLVCGVFGWVELDSHALL